ncbi:unnamed protein product [Phyllotreta striolata]|uniref:Uncharacterized protein n=1 Tax=Phyllotreta striolata TaxID=444603 RepID=A0A9N9TLN1_PHYSR|nr:unnamed protein product [Phyllotreta striolata]
MFMSTQDILKAREKERLEAAKKDREERLLALKELLPNAPTTVRRKLNNLLQDLFDKNAEYSGKTKTFNVMAIIIDNLHRVLQNTTSISIYYDE